MAGHCIRLSAISVARALAGAPHVDLVPFARRIRSFASPLSLQLVSPVSVSSSPPPQLQCCLESLQLPPPTHIHLHHHTAAMPPKPASKTPATAGKAPAGKAPAEKKEAGKKTAPSGDKKKRTKARKETYSSYIYKGKLTRPKATRFESRTDAFLFQCSSRSTPTLVSRTAPCPS